MEEYKAFADFKSEVIEGAISTYHFGFKEYLGKVKEFFTEVDISLIVTQLKGPVEVEDKEGEAAPSEVATP
ncbi:putative methyltransferase PMT21 [Cocos nucifera]|uniref:Putative methyltransferase PMT21 n=1 Tax=Cocos nucifera TaxID=13894 RepID=A0A8K0I6X9_COCNU|nr:putative methyltransferase PMT21 [Cocos nucifera]